MKPDDYKPEIEQRSGDALDRLLDGALAQYSQVEPRAGLEERVLANLRSQPARRPWWMWAVIPAAVAAVLLLTMVLRRPDVSAPGSTRSKPVTAQATPPAIAPKPATTAAIQPGPVSKPRPHRIVVAAARPAPQVSAQPMPRLETFPSATPLTAEERLLLRMIDHHRDELVTVAQSQQADQERFQKLLETEGGETPPQGSSNQQ